MIVSVTGSGTWQITGKRKFIKLDVKDGQCRILTLYLSQLMVELDWWYIMSVTAYGRLLKTGA